MADSRIQAGNMQYGPEIICSARKYKRSKHTHIHTQSDRVMSKGHRNQLKKAPSGQS